MSSVAKIDFDSLASEMSVSVLDLLVRRHETFAVAESLTAGLLCASFTSVPGASEALRGGAVTYATECKHLLADVPRAVLDEFGPVSPVTAKYMAFGIAHRARSTWGVSLTGVAGPDSQDSHPVGEVWCGISCPNAHDVEGCVVKRLEIDKSVGRTGIRQQSVIAALEFFLENLGKNFYGGNNLHGIPVEHSDDQ